MADAQKFENLLKRIHQLPDDDIALPYWFEVYRDLSWYDQHYRNEKLCIKNKEPRADHRSIGDIQYEYSRLCVKVWGRLHIAIKEGINKYKDRLTPTEITMLNFMALRPSRLSRKRVDFIMDRVDKVFAEERIRAT